MLMGRIGLAAGCQTTELLNKHRLDKKEDALVLGFKVSFFIKKNLKSSRKLVW